MEEEEIDPNDIDNDYDYDGYDDGEDYVGNMIRDEGATSTHQGAKPKVSSSNYDQILKENTIEDIKRDYPKIGDDVDVRILKGGVIQISVFGSKEWVDFIKNGKINSFRGELKKALGPPLVKLEREYFIEVKKNSKYERKRF